MSEKVKLTKAQMHALAELNAWRKGLWVATAQLTASGVSIPALRSLFDLHLVDAQVTSTGKYWKLYPAGRTALEQSP